jgi:hypothetical protein
MMVNPAALGCLAALALGLVAWLSLLELVAWLGRSAGLL